MWIVDLEEELSLTFRELTPLFEIEEITATFKELLDPTFYQKINRENYVQIYLEDRTIIPNMMNQLRKNLSEDPRVERSNGREVQVKGIRKSGDQRSAKIEVQGFFKEMTNEELTEKQNQWLTKHYKNLRKRNDQ